MMSEQVLVESSHSLNHRFSCTCALYFTVVYFGFFDLPILRRSLQVWLDPLKVYQRVLGDFCCKIFLQAGRMHFL